MAETKEKEYFSQKTRQGNRPGRAKGCKGVAEIKENEYFSQKISTGGSRRGVREWLKQRKMSITAKKCRPEAVEGV